VLVFRAFDQVWREFANRFPAIGALFCIATALLSRPFPAAQVATVVYRCDFIFIQRSILSVEVDAILICMVIPVIAVAL